MDLTELIKAFGGVVTINNYNINIEFKLPTTNDLEETLAWLDANDCFETSQARLEDNKARLNMIRAKKEK